MSQDKPKRRSQDWVWKGNSDTSLAKPTQALRAAEPRLGRSFVQGEPKQRIREEAPFTIGDAIGAQGPALRQATRKPRRRSRRR